MDGQSATLKCQNPRFPARGAPVISFVGRSGLACHAMPCHAMAMLQHIVPVVPVHLRASDARPRRESVHQGTMCALPSGTRKKFMPPSDRTRETSGISQPATSPYVLYVQPCARRAPDRETDTRRRLTDDPEVVYLLSVSQS